MLNLTTSCMLLCGLLMVKLFNAKLNILEISCLIGLKFSGLMCVGIKNISVLFRWKTPSTKKFTGFTLEIDQSIGWYLGFTDISVSAKKADIIGLNRSWQNAVTFLTHPDNLHKKAQQSKSRQLSYNNASRCGFMNKQTRLTMEHASAVAAKTKASSGSIPMLEATTCRCCVRINSHYTSESFRSANSLAGTKVQKSNQVRSPVKRILVFLTWCIRL